MKKLIIVAFATAFLVGCISQEQLARQRDDYSQAQSDLASAMTNATIACGNKQSCDKAFSLAKVYVQENSDMKIQFSDDTVVSTYNATRWGDVALRATKIPGAGESSTIQLVASCLGPRGDVALREDHYYGIDKTDQHHVLSQCARRMAPIYRGFRPYIEPKLQ